MCTTVESVPGTQPVSSASSPLASWAPAEAQLKFWSSARQFSKWPISSEKATLYVCADQVLPRGFAVLYAGWNAYGASWQVFECGVNRMCPNPFATEAVMEPLCPVARSVRSARNPSGVSCRWTRTRSPGLINRSLLRSGFTAAKFGAVKVPVNSGLAGACDTPLLVMYAQLMGSWPPMMKLSHALVLNVPEFWSRVRLSMVIAAQYTVAAQPKPSNCGT